jgi:hypothetical protein
MKGQLDGMKPGDVVLRRQKQGVATAAQVR